MGNLQTIVRDPRTGVLQGASDPRGAGLAAAGTLAGLLGGILCTRVMLAALAEPDNREIHALRAAVFQPLRFQL